MILKFLYLILSQKFPPTKSRDQMCRLKCYAFTVVIFTKLCNISTYEKSCDQTGGVNVIMRPRSQIWIKMLVNRGRIAPLPFLFEVLELHNHKYSESP